MKQITEFARCRSFGPTPRYNRVLEYEPPQRPWIKVAGPCSVESVDHIRTMGRIVAQAGATHLRGGVFRAGTYPGDNFGWVPQEMISAMFDAAVANGLQSIVEVLDYSDKMILYWLMDHAHCFQVGARQMQNYQLLKVLGQTGRTIFLKRNPGSTMDEWLGAAEYVIKAGGHPVLIERGGATHLNHVRWDLSISIIPAVKSICNVPIIVDAAHGTGRRDLVAPMTLAGVAAGADGCLVEVHEKPTASLSDSDQAITPADYLNLMVKVNAIRGVIA